MTAFVLIHGAGDGGWSWHLVAAELRARGHDAITPDLPTDDDATLTDYADEVVAAVGECRDPVVVGHSFGGFTAPLVAGRLAAQRLLLVAAMIPAPGERPDDWWSATGYGEAVREQAASDDGLTGNSDPGICFYHDVPRELAAEALRRERSHPSAAAMAEPWPAGSWPEVATRFIVCTQDRMFPAAFLRRLAAVRLGITADEIAAGHCVGLSRPQALAELLIRE